MLHMDDPDLKRLRDLVSKAFNQRPVDGMRTRIGARGFIPMDDDGPKKEHFHASHPRAPQHVLTPAFVDHITEYDASSAAAGCRVPVAHIGDVTTAISRSDLAHFQKLTPQPTLALTLGTGHFAPLIVPDQINAMLARFVALHTAE